MKQEEAVNQEKDVLCNLCGLSCLLDKGGSCESLGGLVNKTVCGGYSSTAGNGCGALDDDTTYTFSLCEFCLDWLFQKFKIPVAVGDLQISVTDQGLAGVSVDKGEVWKPAEERVAADDWRTLKKQFFEEAERRAIARNRKIPR